MPTLVPIPKLGQSEEVVKIEKWRVKEGDAVKKGDVLFEVETDKAVLEVESQFEGTLLKIVIPAGMQVPVMSTCAVIGKPGEAIPDVRPPAPVAKKPEAARPAAAAVAPAAAKTPQQAAKCAAPAMAAVPVTPVAIAPSWKPKPSPRARTFAKDYLINIDRISGSGGANGRVTEKDVRDYLESSGYFAKKITPTAFNVAKMEGLDLVELVGSRDNGRITLADVKAAASEKPKEMSTMRKIIAARLAESKRTIPHFYVTVSIDMSDLLAFRKKLKSEGLEFSVNAFIVKAVAQSLKECPMCNATTDGLSVKNLAAVNIGVAVSLEKGLVVPVIRNADRKALDEIQAETAELAGKARDGKLTPDEMKGGTFTISNMGMLGVENFAAIINPGESAILAVSSTIPTPVVKEKAIVARDMMKITLSADHRVVDGADGAKFANAIKQKLEDRELWQSWI